MREQTPFLVPPNLFIAKPGIGYLDYEQTLSNINSYAFVGSLVGVLGSRRDVSNQERNAPRGFTLGRLMESVTMFLFSL